MKNWKDLDPKIQTQVIRGFNATMEAIAGDLSLVSDERHIDILNLTDMMVTYSQSNLQYAGVGDEAKQWLKEACKGTDKYENITAAVKEWKPKGFYL